MRWIDVAEVCLVAACVVGVGSLALLVGAEVSFRRELRRDRHERNRATQVRIVQGVRDGVPFDAVALDDLDGCDDVAELTKGWK